MIPILYETTETQFASNGLGALSDAHSCVVTEERNGPYELEMTYSIDGLHFSDIQLSRIIFAEPSDGKDPQPFDIYKITKPINGVVTIYAQHVSYRLSYIPVIPFSSTGAAATLRILQSNSVGENIFACSTTLSETPSVYSQKIPMSFKQCLGGTEGSVLDVFGGEYEWDKFRVMLHAHRGSDTGIKICYGKNLTDVTQEESLENTITGIYPYWTNVDNTLLTNCCSSTHPDGVIECKNASSFPYKKIIPMDFSSDFEEQPTSEELGEYAKKIIDECDLGVPDVNLTVSFIALWQTEEYKNIAGLERVNLCDKVTIEFPELGVNATAKVIKTVYDVLAERYTSIELGNAKSSVATTIAAISKKSEEKVTYSALEQSLAEQTKLISGGLGGNIITNYDANGRPCEIIICESATPSETAGNCIRLNMNGIGFSNTGYNGPFSSAWTIDSKFNANFIGAGEIDGVYIKAGTIYSGAIPDSTKKDITADTDAELDALSKDVDDRFTDLGKYVRISGGKIILGSINNGIKLRIENDRIVHLVGDDLTGDAKSFWTNDSFDISHLHKFRLGDMAIVAQPNGSISFVTEKAVE